MAISKRFQRGILPAAAARAPDEEGPGPAGAVGSARVTASTVVDVVAATNADILKRGRWTKIAKSYKPNKQPKQE